DATTDAVTYGNLALATVPLKSAIHENAAARTLETALRMTASVAESVLMSAGPDVRAELVQSVPDSETLPVVLKELARAVPERERAAVVRSAPLLAELLRDLGPKHFDIVLAAMARAEVDEVRNALTQYLRKHAQGREQTIGEMLN